MTYGVDIGERMGWQKSGDKQGRKDKQVWYSVRGDTGRPKPRRKRGGWDKGKEDTRDGCRGEDGATWSG